MTKKDTELEELRRRVADAEAYAEALRNENHQWRAAATARPRPGCVGDGTHSPQ